VIKYRLPGTKEYQERIYPSPSDLDEVTRKRLGTVEDVIGYFTQTSLAEDRIKIRRNSLSVTSASAGYTVSFDPLVGFKKKAEQFREMHKRLLDAKVAGLALSGVDGCRKTLAWNPMAGYPVNSHDGPSEWIPCLPLGMPIVNHRAVTLLHYPPIAAYRTADYFNNNTLHRWAQILKCVGIQRPELYHAVVDINPIAAPGSGASEYPNDQFPIGLTSLFFDHDEPEESYVRSMLEVMLNPPANAASPFTLPLIVCGSPLYDPQPVGWFRTRYKGQMPRNANGTPITDMLQVGFVKINPGSRKQTPYMIANHMIAAGVTGRCTSDPSSIPNILKYEAQDLVAATYLRLFDEAARKGPSVNPAAAVAHACQRWFGAADGSGAPRPSDPNDRLTMCALAQRDLCYDAKAHKPMYTYEQARTRCLKQGGMEYSPCFGCASLDAAN
jgi:hypothetical protein